VKNALPYYRKKGLLDETPLRFELEAYRAKPTPLRYPGKVLADDKGQRLFIADSSHNRIVITRLDGTLIDVVGSGTRGKADGQYAAAQFDDPQGMALDGDALYVADTKNHAIRKIALDAREVSTVAGTGQQRRELASNRKSHAKNSTLASPWDLCIHENDLYVAMAGSHQIWKMGLDGAQIAPYAGNGREDTVDGPLLPKSPYQIGFASFAQPSGLASDGTWLYVADSEGSSIRAVAFNPRGEVRTVVGTSQLAAARLFTFGDVDGVGQQVRLQHPLAVAYYDGKLFVADTYNNKIKAVDPQSGKTTTLVGSSQSGSSDSPPTFYEPAGISAAAGRLYVADTNNHEIRVIDLRAKNQVSTLKIPALAPPAPPVRKYSIADTFAGARQERPRPANVRPENGVVRVAIDLRLPPGYKLNEMAPMTYLVEAGKSVDTVPLLAEQSLEKLTRIDKPTPQFEIALPVNRTSGDQTILLGLNYYYCRPGADGICKAGTVVWTVPFRLARDASQSVISLQHQVK
jgi:sugar lactone lactonase YvrE